MSLASARVLLNYKVSSYGTVPLVWLKFHNTVKGRRLQKVRLKKKGITLASIHIMKEAFVEVPARIYIQYYIKEESVGIT